MLPMKFIGNGVVATTTPRMATEQPLGGQIKTFERTMTTDGFDGIGRTRGGETTTGRRERRYAPTIKVDGEE